MSGSRYLERLPPALRERGESSNGEIEIVTEPELLQRIIALRAHGSGATAVESTEPDGDLGIVFEDEYLLVVRDPVRFPSNELGTYIRVIERANLSGSLGVVALPERGGRILLREIFRHANRRWELEAPRGMREAQHSIEETLELEIAQELGLPILSAHPLGSIAANSGILSGDTEMFFIRVGKGDEISQPELTEALGRIVELSVPELMSRIASGEIKDAHTLSAVVRAISLGYLNV
jgi:ADP-ribose pyrophosphatase